MSAYTTYTIVNINLCVYIKAINGYKQRDLEKNKAEKGYQIDGF
uniref:Uncharacterized protein n=1 Tax=Anguilla anguilla TaxID=7936 RepID=A0A0E9T950_ANGAN